MKRTAMLLIALTAAVPLFAAHRRALSPSGPPCSNAVLAEPYVSSDLAVDANYLYFTDDNGGLFRLPKSGGAAPALLANAAGPIGAIAIDAQNMFFIQVDTDVFGSVYSLPKTGGTPVLLASNVVSPLDLVIDDAYLYWNSLGTPTADGQDVQADGKIEKMRKDGTGRVTLAQQLSAPFSIALDGDNVLFGETGLAIGNDSAGLRSVPKAGGSVTTLTERAPVIGIAAGPNAIYFGTISTTSFGASIQSIDRTTKQTTELAAEFGALPLTVKVAGDQVYYYLLSDEDSISVVSAAGGSSRLLQSGGFSTPEFLVDGCVLYYAALDLDTFEGSIRRGPR